MRGPSTLIAFIAGVLLSTTTVVYADTTEAGCEVFPAGSKNASFSGTCMFSQRQGFVTITLMPSGKRYDFRPDGDRANAYKDEKGEKLTRTLSDKGQVYKTKKETIKIYWDISAAKKGAKSEKQSKGDAK